MNELLVRGVCLDILIESKLKMVRMLWREDACCLAIQILNREILSLYLERTKIKER